MTNKSKIEAKKPEEKLQACLTLFDSLNLDDDMTRRTTVKPLHDYFQILIYEIAWRFYGQDRNCLINQGLEARWNMLKNIPSLTEDFEKYTPLIRLIQFMRGKVDHKDEYFPAKTDLEHVREEIPKFIEWFLKIGRSYYEEAKNFSLVQAFLASARWYVGQADWIQHQYGEKMPYSIKTEIELQEYNSIKTLREKVAAKILQINVIEDLKKDDFDTLIQLIKQIERIDAQESVLLSLNLCPKCGCKIIETHNTINRGGYEAEPVGEVWRIGCEKCDYELNNETIEY